MWRCPPSDGPLNVDAPSDFMRAHTFSICAVDPATGESGVAVASRCLSVAGLVCYAAAGVGAIATQAVVNRRYGVDGLALLAKGLGADEVIRRLTDADVTTTPDEPRFREQYAGEQMTEEGTDFFRDPATGRLVWLTRRCRQLGLVDRTGRAAAHNGERIFDWSGSSTGEGFSCQGNLLAGPDVIASMVDAFSRERDRHEHLVAALLAALEAGDAAGGDRRGKLAAGILVVRDRAHWTGSDRWCDIRVDHHPEPVAELGRILREVGFVK